MSMVFRRLSSVFHLGTRIAEPLWNPQQNLTMKTTLFPTIALSFTLAACGPLFPLGDFLLRGGTEGERGAATFSTRDGSDCLFQCGLTDTFAVGAALSIDVEPHGQENGLRFVSTDPHVMTVGQAASLDCCRPGGSGQTCRYSLGESETCSVGETPTYSVGVAFEAPGSARLQVLRADGSILDQIRIAAAPVLSARLELKDGKAVPSAGLSRVVGSEDSYRVIQSTWFGAPLKSSRMTVVTSSNPNVVAFRPGGGIFPDFLFPPPPRETGGAEGVLIAVGVGVARLDLAGGGSVTVTVTP